MRRRPRLYIETSVFGFHFDRREANCDKSEATRRLFAQIRGGIFEGYTGAAAVLELERTSDQQLKDAIFELLRETGISILRLDPAQRHDVSQLAEEYVTQGAIPPQKVDDAIHIATMVVRPDLDILVTWNCRHIANLNVERKVKVLTLAAGYEFNFRIMTPEEVVDYEA